MTVLIRSLLLSSAVVLALAACKKQAPQTPPAPEVNVINAQISNVPLIREFSGRLAPVRSADVRARVAGVLLKRVYEEGTDVQEGQVMFLIDPAPLNANLSSAKGQQASAQATYNNAHAAAERARKLAPEKYISQSDLDSAEATERSAAAALQEAQAAVTNAQINLSYASVSAPIAGRAGKQQVTEGALVGADGVTLLTTVDQIDPLYINFTMDNNELQSLKQEQSQGGVNLASTNDTKLKVILSNGQTYDQVGTLDFSDVVVNQATGTVSLRATLPNPNKLLLPGSFVTAKVDLGTRNNIFLIPQAAIQRDTSGPYAMVIGTDGTVVRKNVTMEDAAIDNKWVVTNGLQTGDQVIVSGLQKVRQGAPAKAVANQPANTAQQPAQGQAK